MKIKLVLCMLGKLQTGSHCCEWNTLPLPGQEAWLGDSDSHRMQAGRGKGLLCPPASPSSLALLLVAPCPPERVQTLEASGRGAACGNILTSPWLLYPLAPLSISALEPEAGDCSRFLICFLPPYHFTFTQQVLTYLVPAGGLPLGWALGIFL